MRDEREPVFTNCGIPVIAVTYVTVGVTKKYKQPCRDPRLHPQPRRLENPLISAHLMTRG